MNTTIQKPTIGRVVHYTNSDKSTSPAIITKYPATSTRRVDLKPVVETGTVDLVILSAEGAHTNDARLINRIDIPYSFAGAPGTWRYPPQTTDTIDIAD